MYIKQKLKRIRYGNAMQETLETTEPLKGKIKNILKRVSF